MLAYYIIFYIAPTTTANQIRKFHKIFVWKNQNQNKNKSRSCSICVSGVCLTATAIDSDRSRFTVGLAPETMRRTYFPNLQVGDRVNLERASEIGGRNSGHFVQGHVDGTGQVLQRFPDDDSLVYHIHVPLTTNGQTDQDMLRYIVPKGFVAVDGTSLTVIDVNRTERWFSFMLVDYTQKHVIIPMKQVGDLVNLEVDVLGKYSESAIATLIPRLEAMEDKITLLEQQLAKVSKNHTMS